MDAAGARRNAAPRATPTSLSSHTDKSLFPGTPVSAHDVQFHATEPVRWPLPRARPVRSTTVMHDHPTSVRHNAAVVQDAHQSLEHLLRHPNTGIRLIVDVRVKLYGIAKRCMKAPFGLIAHDELNDPVTMSLSENLRCSLDKRLLKLGEHGHNQGTVVRRGRHARRHR